MKEILAKIHNLIPFKFINGIRTPKNGFWRDINRKLLYYGEQYDDLELSCLRDLCQKELEFDKNNKLKRRESKMKNK